MKTTIKIERARFNMSQSDLAKKVGVSRQTINKIENGKAEPGVSLAQSIALCFNISTDELFNNDKNK